MAQLSATMAQLSATMAQLITVAGGNPWREDLGRRRADREAGSRGENTDSPAERRKARDACGRGTGKLI
jgi:UDP-N-acetylmuramyl tripeptide synthase